MVDKNVNETESMKTVNRIFGLATQFECKLDSVLCSPKLVEESTPEIGSELVVNLRLLEKRLVDIYERIDL